MNDVPGSLPDTTVVQILPSVNAVRLRYEARDLETGNIELHEEIVLHNALTDGGPVYLTLDEWSTVPALLRKAFPKRLVKK